MTTAKDHAKYAPAYLKEALKLTEAQERERASWQYRVIAASRGNSTLIGTLVLAVLGRNAKSAPAAGENAIITDNGWIVTKFLTREGKLHEAAPVGRVSDIVDVLRQLSDAALLNDAERVEFFAQVRAWIVRDYRATSDPEEWEIRQKQERANG